MPSFDFITESEVSSSARVKQLSAMFDVPITEKVKLSWQGDLPIDDGAWNVGLIVGPSGCGKSSIIREVFGETVEFSYKAKSVIDDFDSRLSMQRIAEACQAVGFNTIPAWIRPFNVLSNGERFRVNLARHLLETGDPIVMDEFTSVVDRQVAQIGSHAAQKYVRRYNRKFIAATCHYDVIDWLQPDWVFEPATMSYGRRCLRRRPGLEVTISRVPRSAWRVFAPFHYLTAELHRSAKCFALFVGDRIASFAAMLHRPHARVRDITGCSRLVTLPDWQGLGLAMILIEKLGAAYKAIGRRLHTYPAHPALIRSFGKSNCWKMVKRPGTYCSRQGDTGLERFTFKPRPCAVFSYSGEPMQYLTAHSLIN